MKVEIERQIQQRLEQFKAELSSLRHKADQAEVNLELEYYTLLDELQLEIETFESKLQLLRDANEESWHQYRSELEKSWQDLRELVKAVTSP